MASPPAASVPWAFAGRAGAGAPPPPAAGESPPDGAPLSPFSVDSRSSGSLGDDAVFAHGRARRRRYRVLRTLGAGTEGHVRSALCLDTFRPVAIKCVVKGRHGLPERDRRAAFELLQGVDHPALPRLVEQFETQDKWYTVMELCATDLQRFLVSRGGRLPEFQIRTVLARILSGLAYLHARGIAHRDLKPQNVLLRHPDRFDDLCLTDFDCARRVPRGDPSQSGFHTLVGTPFFLAPEMVHRPDGGYGVKVDIYAVGVIGYMLLCGVTPFESAGTMVELYDRIVQRSWSWPEGLGSADFRRFVERLMAAGPAERPSAEEALGDAWMARPGLPRMLSGANVVFDSETGELKWIPVG